MATLKNTDKSLQAIHNHMLGAHDLSLPDVELDAIIEVVKLAEGDHVPAAGNMIDQWQTIDTAPKHGGSHLVTMTIGKIRYYHLAHWCFDTDKFIYHPGISRQPTHWQPLLSPPTD
jgi:hypothetical protein